MTTRKIIFVFCSVCLFLVHVGVARLIVRRDVGLTLSDKEPEIGITEPEKEIQINPINHIEDELTSRQNNNRFTPEQISGLLKDGTRQDLFKRYHNYKDLETELTTIANKYPSISRLYSVGKSVQNRELFVLEISENVTKHVPGKPHFKYVANMHGDETVGRQLMIYLAILLTEGYGKIPRVTNLVKNVHIHLMPSMNPDGFEGSRRGNAKGVDLNRDFPDPLKIRQTTPQPETSAVMEWLKKYEFVLSANLHGGALVANYPLDGNKRSSPTYTASPDDAVFRQISIAYSKNHPYMYDKSKCEQFKEGITNGADWYPIRGGMQDWNYLNTNAFEITLEVSCIKYPFASRLERFWSENVESLFAFMEEINKGIKGFVTDQNNNPIPKADVIVNGIDHTVTSSCHGEIHRLVVPGTYQVTVNKQGCTSQTKAVTVAALDAARVNFTLDCGSTGVVNPPECRQTGFPYKKYVRNSPAKPLKKSILEEELVTLEEKDKKVILIPELILEKQDEPTLESIHYNLD